MSHLYSKSEDERDAVPSLRHVDAGRGETTVGGAAKADITGMGWDEARFISSKVGGRDGAQWEAVKLLQNGPRLVGVWRKVDRYGMVIDVSIVSSCDCLVYFSRLYFLPS